MMQFTSTHVSFHYSFNGSFSRSHRVTFNTVNGTVSVSTGLRQPAVGWMKVQVNLPFRVN